MCIILKIKLEKLMSRLSRLSNVQTFLNDVTLIYQFICWILIAEIRKQYARNINFIACMHICL